MEMTWIEREQTQQRYLPQNYSTETIEILSY